MTPLYHDLICTSSSRYAVSCWPPQSAPGPFHRPPQRRPMRWHRRLLGCPPRRFRVPKEAGSPHAHPSPALPPSLRPPSRRFPQPRRPPVPLRLRCSHLPRLVVEAGGAAAAAERAPAGTARPGQRIEAAADCDEVEGGWRVGLMTGLLLSVGEVKHLPTVRKPKFLADFFSYYKQCTKPY